MRALIEVEHHNLTPADREANKLASVCPSCKQGTLCVRRNSQTFVIEAVDICLLCGAQIIYTDVERMRQTDWAKA